MAIGIPPQPHHFSQASRIFNNTSLFNKHLASPLSRTLTADSFNSERKRLLEAMEDPTLFEAVLDESKRPIPQVKALRASLSRQKINTQELFKSPALLKNLYNHLALQAETQLKTTTDKAKREELKLQVVMMRSLVESLNISTKELSPSPTCPDLSKVQSQSILRFGGINGLFAKTMMLFTDKGQPDKTQAWKRKEASDKIINTGSAFAAIAAGSLTKIAFADDAVLTAITVGTITRMAYGVYGIEDTSPATLGVIIGKVAGARVADGALTYAIEKGLAAIPLLGEITTASTAFGLHQATCRLFRLHFENQVEKKQKPGFPMTIRALTTGLGLAQATNLVDLNSEQPSHYNTLNDVRAESNDYDPAPHNFMELSSGKIQEIHNILDHSNNLIGIPNKDDFLNTVLASASSADDVINVAMALSKVRPALAKSVVKEFNDNGKISAGTMNKMLGLGADLSVGAMLLLGGPNHLQNPGLLANLDSTNTVYQYLKQNGLDVDFKAVAGWTSAFGVHMKEVLRNKVVQKVENSPAYQTNLKAPSTRGRVVEIENIRTAEAIDKVVEKCTVM